MSIKTKVRNRINRLSKPFGFKIVSLQDPATKNADYVLYQYKDEKGDFDYEKYKTTQVKGNEIKIDKVWVLEDNVKFLSDYIKKSMDNVNFGLCHGTRRGVEQTWFRKYLDCEVIGTEISESAKDFPHTIQWDFHTVKDEWINNVDFIYSNSLDHSYDPEMCLNTWISCLKPNGICIIEHSSSDVPSISNQLDPFGAKIEMMPFLIAKWGKGNYHLKELVHAPKMNEHVEYLYFLVIRKTK